MKKVAHSLALIWSFIYALGCGGTIFGSLYFLLPFSPSLLILSALAGVVVTYVNWHMCKKRVPEAWNNLVTPAKPTDPTLTSKQKLAMGFFVLCALAVGLFIAALTWQAFDYFLPGHPAIIALITIVVATTFLTELGLMMKSIKDMILGKGFMPAIQAFKLKFKPKPNTSPEEIQRLKKAKWLSYGILFILSILTLGGLAAFCFAGQKSSEWVLNKIPGAANHILTTITSWSIGALGFIGNLPFVADTLTITANGTAHTLLNTQKSTYWNNGLQKLKASGQKYWKPFLLGLLVGAAIALALGLSGIPGIDLSAHMIAVEVVGASLLVGVFSCFAAKEAAKTKDEASLAAIITNGTVNGAVSGPACLSEFGLALGIASMIANSGLSLTSGAATVVCTEESVSTDQTKSAGM